MSKTFEEKVREICREMEGFVTNDDMFEVGIISLIRLFDVEITQAKLEERDRISNYIQERKKHVNIFSSGTGDMFVEDIVTFIREEEKK